VCTAHYCAAASAGREGPTTYPSERGLLFWHREQARASTCLPSSARIARRCAGWRTFPTSTLAVLATRPELASTKGAVALPAGLLLSSDTGSHASRVPWKPPQHRRPMRSRPRAEACTCSSRQSHLISRRRSGRGGCERPRIRAHGRNPITRGSARDETSAQGLGVGGGADALARFACAAPGAAVVARRAGWRCAAATKSARASDGAGTRRVDLLLLARTQHNDFAVRAVQQPRDVVFIESRRALRCGRDHDLLERLLLDCLPERVAVSPPALDFARRPALRQHITLRNESNWRAGDRLLAIAWRAAFRCSSRCGRCRVVRRGSVWRRSTLRRARSRDLRGARSRRCRARRRGRSTRRRRRR